MEADRFHNLPIAGTYGDAAVFESTVTFAGESNPQTVDFAEIPAGAKILSVELVNDALGASTTLSVGARYKDGTAAAPAKYLAAAASASAGSRKTAMHPERLDKTMIVTGTLGGAAATGKVTVYVLYKYEGAE